MVYACEVNLECIENILKVIDLISNDMAYMPLDHDQNRDAAGALESLTKVIQWHIDDLRKDDHLL